MRSAICRSFAGNAWRSDLCANCFKSREEHDRDGDLHRADAARYVAQAPALLQSRGLPSSMQRRLGGDQLGDRVSMRDFGSQTSLAKPAAQQQKGGRGILVTAPHKKKKLRSRSSVEFASEEAMVIGYGGRDYDSDTSPWEMGSDDGSVDLEALDDNDDDRQVTRLTKHNTEFNSSNDNLDDKPKANDISQIRTDKALGILFNDKSKANDITTEKTVGISFNNNLNDKEQKSKGSDIRTDKALGQHLSDKDREQKSRSGEISQARTNKALDILFKDSPAKEGEKKISQYYFSTSMGSLGSTVKSPDDERISSSNEKQKSPMRDSAKDNLVEDDKGIHFAKPVTIYSPCDSVLENDKRKEEIPVKSYLHCAKVASKSKELVSRDLKVDTSQRVIIVNESSKNILQNEFTPLNTRTYSYVSELNKNSLGSEHGSDSDYSTSRLTAGDSTDSESFPEEARVRPCNSFLHGNYPRALIDSLDSDKKYDAGSSTSGDISNLSDDSDSHDIADRKRLDSKSTQKSADSATTDSRKSKKTDSSDKESPRHSKNRQAPSAPKVQVTCTNSSSGDESSTSVPVKQSPEIQTNKSNDKSTTHQGSKHVEKVSITIKSNSSLPDLCYPTPQNNVIFIDGSPIKTGSSPNEPARKESSRSKTKSKRSPDPPSTSSSLSDETTLPTSESLPQNSDDSDCERSPGDRQTKLAALAMELELARRESKICSKTPPAPPPEVKSATSWITPENYPKANVITARTCHTLPDILQETPTPAKTKKSRFSLKKLLRRNKESAVLTSTDKEVNPKAWKSQSFDRSRLSLEILHPMDLMEGSGGRARSMSCLAPEEIPLSNARKAGTVAERKKNRPALVRTPSCSAIPNRPANRSQAPPKPPPPPKCKTTPPPPPPPPHQSRSSITPPRPPPPKIPDMKFKTFGKSTIAEEEDEDSSEKDYANLGEIRSQLIPAKPVRPSAPSAPSREPSEARTEDEEDHYSSLEEVQSSPCKSGARPWMDLQTSYAAIAAASFESLAQIKAVTASDAGVELLRSGSSLKWSDFALEASQPRNLSRGRRCFDAVLTSRPQLTLTLLVTPGRRSHAQTPMRRPLLASFCDCLPRDVLPVQWATIYVLKRSRLTSVADFAQNSSSSDQDQHLHLRNYCFVLLQFIHTLKSMQAEGVEEARYDPEQLLLEAGGEERPPVLVPVPDDQREDTLTLCQTALAMLMHFLQTPSSADLQSCVVNGAPLSAPVARSFAAIADALRQERAPSLSQARALLEHMLWGPVDVPRGAPDALLRRWLDLQRAQLLGASLRSLREDDAYRDFQLGFLLQATVASLRAVVAKL